MTQSTADTSIPATPLPINKRSLFILALVVAAAVVMQAASSWQSLIIFGASLLMVVVVSLVVRDLQRQPGHRQWLVPLAIAGLVGIFIFSRFTRAQILVFGHEVTSDGEWIGLSYLILRLIHVIVDSNKLSASVSPPDMIAYALFPPALIAGPIHRATQFLPQLANVPRRLSQPEVINHLERIGIGFLKKFVIADFLTLFALDAKVVNNPYISTPVLWLSLIAYGVMLYFDFAGYSDMAIGVAGLLGIKLPENFANPYAQSDITRFWQSWHISLSTWLRDYVFTPLSRFLLRRFGSRFSTPIMAVSHLTTMAIAGLWHAFKPTFIVWGLWHGAGLFAHSQWSRVRQRQGTKGLPRPIGVLATFLFVTLGWVFFALPDVGTSLHCLTRLIGR